METFKKQVSKNSLYIAIDMNRLSLNSDGAFLTTIQSLTPKASPNTSTVKRKEKLITFQFSFGKNLNFKRLINKNIVLNLF